MASVVQFVDRIATSPTVRFDLNSRNTVLVATEGIELSPPEYRRVTVSTMMSDGEIIPAASYGNRVLRFPLLPLGATAEAAATIIQNLTKELARPTNILKLQLQGMTAPVFFETFAAPDYTLAMLRLLLTARTTITLEIPARPFALGTEETLGPFTVNDDPSNGSNGMYFDITGIKGDIETPLVLTLPTSTLYDSSDPMTVLAVRRRGTASNVPFWLDAEGMTLDTDTTLPGNSSVMVPAGGNNFTRTSFATNSNMVRRFHLDTFPVAVNADVRGTYRVFAGVRRSSATGTINVRLGYTASTAGVLVQNDSVATAESANRCHMDLGLITFPTGLDPVTRGYSNVELSVKGRYIEVAAERASGSSNIDFDYLLFMPADDCLAMIDWGDAISSTDEFVVDGVHELIYTQTTSDEVYGSKPSVLSGGFPMVSPGVTNRIFWIRRAGRGATATKTETTVISVSYWPRYLFVRPAST